MVYLRIQQDVLCSEGETSCVIATADGWNGCHSLDTLSSDVRASVIGRKRASRVVSISGEFSTLVRLNGVPVNTPFEKTVMDLQ